MLEKIRRLVSLKIVVCVSAGQTASLISKYRPPMPILTLVIPTLKNDGMKWTLVGRGVARQCQIQRGLLPVLAAPSPSGEYSDLCGGLILLHCYLWQRRILWMWASAPLLSAPLLHAIFASMHT